MPQKIVIDADPGIGDALAVLTAMVDPSVEVIGLTATAGSVPGIQATRNLQFLTDLIDPLKHPRIGECTRPSVVPGMTQMSGLTRHSFCGQNGLGDLEISVPDLHNRRESAKLIVDLVHEFPHEVRILTLGPLTNVATAFDLDPELPNLLDGIISLGGTHQAAGDVSAVAEFNIWCDPESASIVFQSPAASTLVPLDVSGTSILTFDDVDVLTDLIESTKHGSILTSMLQFLLRANHQLAFEGIPLHSLTALAVAARAESFAVQSHQVEVEKSGELTRGMTVVDRRRSFNGPTNIDVVSAIDDHGVIDFFSRSLKRIAG